MGVRIKGLGLIYSGAGDDAGHENQEVGIMGVTISLSPIFPLKKLCYTGF